MKAIVKNLVGFPIGDMISVTAGHTIGDCIPMYEVGREYPVSLDHEYATSETGELFNRESIVILDGMTDGYDRETGVRFSFVGYANRYFSFID